MENVVRGAEKASPQGRSMAAVRTHCRRNAVGGGGKQLKKIRWDRFLPRRSLRVLLVENDDSTRHIVAALLRKCSYHVAAVADGLKAWEVMKEKSYSFDLVLTEFEVPSLSGIGLLGKIVGTEECKNIPVIMMSSQDSVGIVHKCMLKGAADFLVKPLRKNELRNLWQHVWRRHFSSSYACASEKNAASSNTGDWSQTGETSDKGSDANQSLGSKLDTKVEISQKQAKHGQSPREAEAHLEQPRNNMNTIVSSSVLNDNGVLQDKTLVVGGVAVQPIQMAYLIENSGHASLGQDDLVSLRCANGGNEKPNSLHQINSQEELSQEVLTQSSDGLMKSLSNGQRSHAFMKTAVIDENVSTDTARSSQLKHVFNLSTLPLWDLSLMTKLNGCGEYHVKRKNILNHSNASAFSRYGGTSTTSAAGKSNSSPICIRSKEYVDQPRGTDNVKLFTSRVDDGVQQFQMFSDANMVEIGALSSYTASHAQLGFMPTPIPVGAVPYTSFCKGYGELLPPLINQDSSLIVQSLDDSENMQQDDDFVSHSGSIEFRCHDLNHPLPFRGQVNDAEAGEHTDFRCNYTNRDFLKGCGSNGSDNTNSDLSHREAALIKFRLKRKDRCFAKKVRYHSRQKLAEQRPRVKGQFVSQKIPQLNSTQEEDDYFFVNSSKTNHTWLLQTGHRS